MKVGLVTGEVTPSARHAPRTNVVFPLPSSPATVTEEPVAEVEPDPESVQLGLF